MIDTSAISNVQASIWINASAGSGKTKNLIDRIMALLLSGVEPHKILCITYTKNAAQEMLERLDSELSKLSHTNLAMHNRLRSQQYAQRWVRIDTIHGFAHSLLAQHSTNDEHNICDDVEQRILIKQAIRRALLNDDLTPSFKQIAFFSNNLYTEIIPHFSALKMFFASSHTDLERTFSEIFSAEILSYQQIMPQFTHMLFRRIDDLQQLVQMMRHTSALERDHNTAAEISRCIETRDIALINIFYTQKLEPRKSIISSALSKALPESTPLLQSLREHIDHAMDWRARHMSANINVHMFRVCQHVVREYESLKEAENCIDFTDVIMQALQLLSNNPEALYDIDKNLDHVLLDEAQDTSFEQWQLINQITDEFWGHDVRHRTIFVVGDAKQSIYSFQGADSALFFQQKERYKQLINGAGRRFYEISTATSYRSAPQVLQFVDSLNLFQNVQHKANREHALGCVEILPLFQDYPSKINALVEDIAKKISDGCFVPSKNRPACANDFMILFQRRDTIQMKYLIRALRKKNIPVTGMDTIILNEEMLVEDMIALLAWICNPYDDFLLAQLLKTPIFAVSEEDLYKIANHRKKK